MSRQIDGEKIRQVSTEILLATARDIMGELERRASEPPAEPPNVIGFFGSVPATIFVNRTAGKVERVEVDFQMTSPASWDAMGPTHDVLDMTAPGMVEAIYEAQAIVDRGGDEWPTPEYGV
jgi:hypothetical protein